MVTLRGERVKRRTLDQRKQKGKRLALMLYAWFSKTHFLHARLYYLL